jgi:hypothetical protein
VKFVARINSCRKGKVAERAWAEWLNENLNCEARRGASQAGGAAARPDVEFKLAIHSEVKAVQALNLEKAMNQAIRDCRFDNVPIVAHKKNRGVWHITLLASDLVRLSKVISEQMAKLASEQESA